MTNDKDTATDVNQCEITSLNGIRGQPQVVELLRVSIDSFFQNRAKNPDHSFGVVGLFGVSGCGKTVTAKAIHHELANLNLIEANGEFLNNTQELVSILITADENTTLFIDEAHSLRNQNVLLTAISERKLYVPRGRSSKLPRTIPLAPFTLILATTHEFQLEEALRNRVRICCRFDYYTLDSLFDITSSRAKTLGWAYESDEVIWELCRRAKQTPRLAINRNLQMAWAVATSDDRTTITMSDVCEAFRLLRISSLGLDTTEQAYLFELNKHGAAKLNVLASRIGLPTRTISSVVEPFLLRSELITKRGSERVITDSGREHLEEIERERERMNLNG
jgi:Holliday junction DNA helicase RuvB